MVKVLLFLLWLTFPFLCGGAGLLSEATGICLWLGGEVVMLGYLLLWKREMKWTMPDLLMFALTIWGMVRIPWGNGMETLLSGIEWLGMAGLYVLVRQCGVCHRMWYVVALAGMVQVFTGGRYFPNPGPYGGYIAMAWIVWNGLFLSEVRRLGVGRCLLFGAGFLILGWGLVCSDSRSAWLAAAAGSTWGLYGVFPGIFRKGWEWMRRYRGLWIAGSVVFIGSMLLLYAYKPGSVHGRWLIWRVAVRMFLENPWTGQGWGAFGKEYMYAQAAFFREGNAMEGSIYAGDNWQVFNEGLHLLCEQGIIGGVLVGSLLFLLFRRLFGGSIAQSAGIGLSVFSVFSYPASVPALAVFYPLLAGASVNEGDFRIRASGRIGMSVRMIAGVCLITGGVGVVYTIHEVRMAGGILKQALGDRGKLAEALAYFPSMRGPKDYVLCLGRQLYKQGRYREAIPVLEQAAALRPTTGMLCDLGDCYRRQGRYADAEYCFLLARDMVPARLTARYHLFGLYREMDRVEEACVMAREILQTKVKIVNSLTLDIEREARTYLYRFKPS